MALANSLNTGALITLGGTLSTAAAHTLSGAFASTFTFTGITTVTFPVSGTLATTSGASIPGVVQGDLLYGSAVNTLSALAKNTSATRYLSNTGTTNNPAWTQIDLTNGVANTLGVTNGGTGLNSALTASRAVVSDGSGLISAATTTATEIGYVNGVTSSIQAQIDAITIGTSSNTKTITQALHGFSVDQALYLVGTTYTLAIATSVAAAEVVGVVSSVTNVNTFVITTSGYISGLSGKTAGEVSFLSDSVAGQITTTEPASVGNISKAIYVADSTTSAYMVNTRGKVIPTPFSSIVTTVTGTTNQVDVAGTTNPILSLSATAVAPGSLGVTSLTASRAVATNSSKVLVSSATTDTELGYLSGVTSALQTQLNAKGTVTSVATGNGLRSGPITTTGTVNLSVNGTCGFRLSLTTDTPITTANVSGASATTIYCVPYKGNEIALYSGSGSLWNYYQVAQLSIAIPNTANTAYDVFVYDNAGTPTLELTAWTNVTTRATALTYQDGVLSKTGVLTRRYLGSFVTTSTLGQTEDSATSRFLWNYYNRVSRQFIRTETAVSWTYGSTTVRQANANTANQINFFIGVSEDVLSANVVSFCTANGTNPEADVGLTLDGITFHSNTNATWQQALMSTGSLISVALNATYNGYPGIGQHYLAWVESTGGTSARFYGYIGGTGGDTYKNGIMGSIMA